MPSDRLEETGFYHRELNAKLFLNLSSQECIENIGGEKCLLYLSNNFRKLFPLWTQGPAMIKNVNIQSLGYCQWSGNNADGACTPRRSFSLIIETRKVISSIKYFSICTLLYFLSASEVKTASILMFLLCTSFLPMPIGTNAGDSVLVILIVLRLPAHKIQAIQTHLRMLGYRCPAM